ncbi:MAG: cytochrome c oxidase assembly protein, partial [Gammaproteobacteria bacterium]|nr:cytochrome c oxidase assembly protein [Gammaproteobacteria bacterium]
AITGQAVPSVAPGQAAEYFEKTECFCFTEQKLEPGERKQMPVIFVVDPDLPEDISQLALSYTFFTKPSGTQHATASLK